MTKLICPDCKHENEPERIYCHNCGARLDRSAIRKEKASEESVASTQEHLRRMFDPNRGRGRVIAAKLGKSLIGGFCLAIIIQLLLPPDLPPEVKNDNLPPMIGMDLLSAVESNKPAQLTYTEQQVNDYLASFIHRKNSPAQQGYLPIRRISTQLEEGLVRLHVHESFLGLPLFGGGYYHVSIKDGKVVGKNSGGYFGRMPVHPRLMRYLDFAFSKVWDVLSRERKDIGRLGGIEFHPQSVTLSRVVASPAAP